MIFIVKLITMSKLLISESEKKDILKLYNISNSLINEADTKPKTYNEIVDFQKWVLNVKKDKAILGSYGADGDWGPNTNNAWTKYGGQYLTKSNSKNPKGSYNKNVGGVKKGYPYDKLNNNPTPKFIAWVIQQSNGVTNDDEAYAEAAFNAIKTPKVYSQVARYLATDPYKYIEEFMDTKQRYHNKSVYEHYKELFNSTPSNNESPKQNKPDNVRDFQTWVLNVKKDKAILGSYGADGDWGTSTKNAWIKYGSEYLKNSKNNKGGANKFDGFVIPFAFPEYEPHVDGNTTWDKFLSTVSHFITGGDKKNTYGKVGHAGVSIVTNNGDVITYEFGRYLNSNQKVGVKLSKKLGKIAVIKNGEISNLNNVINTIHRNTQGDGPSEKIRYVVLRTPDVQSGIKYANSVTTKDYSALDFSISDSDANCGTFAIEVVRACGVSVPSVCLPTPVAMIDEMELVKNAQDKEYLKLYLNANKFALPVVLPGI
jgi:hypothetical protein